MKFDFLSSASDKELQQFKSVCNQLLSRTYVVRTLYRPGRERLNNPDYTFLTIHAEAVRDYLSLLDWDLRHDDANGIYYVVNTDDANRCILSKRETAILLALRMLYDESLEGLGLEKDALCTVREVLEKGRDRLRHPARETQHGGVQAGDAHSGKPLDYSAHRGKIQPAGLPVRHSADHSDRGFGGAAARGRGGSAKGGGKR